MNIFEHSKDEINRYLGIPILRQENVVCNFE